VFEIFPKVKALVLVTVPVIPVGKVRHLLHPYVILQKPGCPPMEGALFLTLESGSLMFVQLLFLPRCCEDG
jgi:hypothetical protein